MGVGCIRSINKVSLNFFTNKLLNRHVNKLLTYTLAKEERGRETEGSADTTRVGKDFRHLYKFKAPGRCQPLAEQK